MTERQFELLKELLTEFLDAMLEKLDKIERNTRGPHHGPS